MMKRVVVVLLSFILPLYVTAQEDSLKVNSSNVIVPGTSVYKKPKSFSFLINIPTDAAGFSKKSFKKNNLKGLSYIALSSAILYWADQSITNTIQDKFQVLDIDGTEDFSPLITLNIGGKPTHIGKIPKNINTAFYNFGQGSSVMIAAAGFYILGKIKKDNRALHTAAELTQAFLTLGIGTQIMKYATGRENPSDATMPRGRWKPFPRWQDFQQNKTRYDAFPSGHLATLVSAVTIIGENYPEKKWIKPLGYSIAALCGLSMINNGVHWASDFPLAIALGHGYGKYIARKSRIHVTAR
jgi:hypothetical protein